MAKVYRFEQFDKNGDLAIEIESPTAGNWRVVKDESDQLIWKTGDFVEAALTGETKFRHSGQLVFLVEGLLSKLAVDESVDLVHVSLSAFRSISSFKCSVTRIT